VDRDTATANGGPASIRVEIQPPSRFRTRGAVHAYAVGELGLETDVARRRRG
jgi:hypothetical protein